MMPRKKLNLFLIGIAAFGLLLQRGCSNRQSETAAFETRDVLQFDGPYDFVKVNDDGSIVIRKDDKEYTFEFLGFAKGKWLAQQMGYFFKRPEKLWLEYDQNKLSPQGNLQGYAYYICQETRDMSGKYYRIYRMINAYKIWSGRFEFYDDGQTHKHYELLLKEVIRSYKDWIVLQKRGVSPGKGTIWEGRSTSELESKLAEYEKMLEDYRASKKPSN